MDFNTLKYNGKILYLVASLCIFGTWMGAREYYGIIHTQELSDIKHEADTKANNDLVNLKVDFLLREIEDTNGRLSRKSDNNINFFKRELEKVSQDQSSQWTEIKENAKKN